MIFLPILLDLVSYQGSCQKKNSPPLRLLLRPSIFDLFSIAKWFFLKTLPGMTVDVGGISLPFGGHMGAPRVTAGELATWDVSDAQQYSE